MNFEDNYDSIFEPVANPSRTDADFVSLYDSNSRDSGFGEVLPNCLVGDDDFLEEFADIHFAECPNLPTDFSNLIHKPIVTVSVSEKPTFRRAISFEGNVSPLKRKICQKTDGEEPHNFLIRRKKVVRRSNTEEYHSVEESVNLKSLRSEELVTSSLQRSASEPDVIADFSRNYSLPLAASRHKDLKAIDCNTLKNLVNGEFNDRIGSFKIIDCRYPYEYNGGHIKGAINIYTHEQCSSLLETDSSQTSGKPSILIFHCEFSAQRGPNLYRHLRQEDRRRNTLVYPALCFPEMYILEGGYMKFFDENSNLCSPVAYTQMLDPNYGQDMLFFRQSSKTWNSDVKSSNKKNMKNRRTIRKFVL